MALLSETDWWASSDKRQLLIKAQQTKEVIVTMDLRDNRHERFY